MNTNNTNNNDDDVPPSAGKLKWPKGPTQEFVFGGKLSYCITGPESINELFMDCAFQAKKGNKKLCFRMLHFMFATFEEQTMMDLFVKDEKVSLNLLDKAVEFGWTDNNNGGSIRYRFFKLKTAIIESMALHGGGLTYKVEFEDGEIEAGKPGWTAGACIQPKPSDHN